MRARDLRGLHSSVPQPSIQTINQNNSIGYTDHNPMTRPDRNNCWLVGKITVLQRVGSGRYKIHTEKGENVFHTMDLKPSLKPLDNGRNSVHW